MSKKIAFLKKDGETLKNIVNVDKNFDKLLLACGRVVINHFACGDVDKLEK